MAELEHVNQDGFQSRVLNGEMPVLVEFTATWCGPCKMLEPILKELAEQWEGKVQILQVDVDQNAELAMQYNVMGVPTLLFFSKGKLLERTTGYLPKNRLLKILKPHLPF